MTTLKQIEEIREATEEANQATLEAAADILDHQIDEVRGPNQTRLEWLLFHAGRRIQGFPTKKVARGPVYVDLRDVERCIKAAKRRQQNERRMVKWALSGLPVITICRAFSKSYVSTVEILKANGLALNEDLGIFEGAAQ